MKNKNKNKNNIKKGRENLNKKLRTKINGWKTNKNLQKNMYKITRNKEQEQLRRTNEEQELLSRTNEEQELLSRTNKEQELL